MITIKQTNRASDAGHHSMGDDYMRGISKATAKALCGMYPLPEMGYQTIVAAVADRHFPMSTRHRLEVQNISGQYFVACCSVKVEAWPDVFKVKVI